jgi:hypothetical protein
MNNITSENINLKPNNNDIKTSILIIDSRHRDKNKYPNPSNYTYNLLEKYKRVVSAELLYAYIPKTKKIINYSNNEILININDMDYNIQFPIGNYTQNINNISKYNTKLNETINNILSTFSSDVSSIRCFYDYNCDKYYFYNIYPECLNTFSLNFKGKIVEKYDIQHIKKIIKGESKIFREKYLIEKKQLYKEKSIGPILGFKPEVYKNKVIKCYFELLPGFVKITCNSINDFNLLYFTITSKNPCLSRILISNSINFDTNTYLINFNPDKIIEELQRNQPHIINIFNEDNESNYTNSYKIHELNKDNLYIILTNSLNWFNNLDNNFAYISFCFIEADFTPNFQTDPYVLLQINEFNRLESIDTHIQNSYELIPFTDTINIFENSHSYGNIKVFEPILSVLDRLNISFKDLNGNLYDFMGQEHYMAFAITYNNRYN